MSDALREARALMTSSTVEDLTAHLRRMGRARLAAAILNIGISELNWHVSQLVKGEDESAGALADLILDALAKTP